MAVLFGVAPLAAFGLFMLSLVGGGTPQEARNGSDVALRVVGFGLLGLSSLLLLLVWARWRR